MRTSRKDCLLILDKITSSQNPPSSIYTKRSSEFNRNVLNFRITRSSCSCRRRYYNLDTCRYLLNSLYLNYNALRTMFVQNKMSKEMEFNATTKEGCLSKATANEHATILSERRFRVVLADNQNPFILGRVQIHVGVGNTSALASSVFGYGQDVGR